MVSALSRRMEFGPALDEDRLDAKVREILNRHPAVGLAFGVISRGRLVFFRGHGVADVETGTRITKDTAFRIGSSPSSSPGWLMQLWERGLVDLDAPASMYLRAYRLRPAGPGFRPVA